MSYGMRVDSQNIDNVLQSKEIVVVDFWAPWCENSDSISYVLEDVHIRLGKKKIVFGNSNVDNDSMLASKYGIKNLPSLLIFSAGNVMTQIIGSFDVDELEERLFELL